MKWSLTKTHTCRRPTWRGWLLITAACIALLTGLLSNLYSFLAPDRPPHRGLMVVEGWIHDFALDEAVTLYRNGDYSRIICTGVPIETGSYIQQFKSYPEMTATRLRHLGIPEDEILVTIADAAPRDRTYLSAVALREAFITHNISETDLHLVTTGPHGRRSRLLFSKALGDEYNIGISCLEDVGYDPQRWYAYSQGMRKVMSETIAYLYAKLFFHP